MLRLCLYQPSSQQPINISWTWVRRLRVQSCAEQGQEKFFPAAAALLTPLGRTLLRWHSILPGRDGSCWMEVYVVQRLCDLGFVAIMAIIKMSLIGNTWQHNWALVTEIKLTPEADFQTPCLSVGGEAETFLLFQACAWRMILVPRGSALSIKKNKWKGGSQVQQESELCLPSKALI